MMFMMIIDHHVFLYNCTTWASVSAALMPGCLARLFCNVAVHCIISVLFEQ